MSAVQDIDGNAIIPAVSLLFAPGERPGANRVKALAGEGSGFAVAVETPADVALDQGKAGRTLELLTNGLTFDLSGLLPGAAAAMPPRVHGHALPEGIELQRLEAIVLQPGPHLVEGAETPPVVRSLAWLAAQLTALAGARAVAWHPARSWCSPEHFRASVLRWIEGGPFPAFALAVLVPMADGGMASEGMALFAGQELRLEPELVGDRGAGTRIGLRLLSWLTEHGRLEGERNLVGPDGQPLRLEPSANGRYVRVWRG